MRGAKRGWKALLTAENTAIPDNWLNVRGSEMKKHITALTTAKATVHAAELESVLSSFAPTRTWRAGWGVSIGMRWRSADACSSAGVNVDMAGQRVERESCQRVEFYTAGLLPRFIYLGEA